MKIIFMKGNVYFEECQYEDAVAEYERAAELTSNGKEPAEIYVKIGILGFLRIYRNRFR